jgi:hypothetical protein
MGYLQLRRPLVTRLIRQIDQKKEGNLATKIKFEVK